MSIFAPSKRDKNRQSTVSAIGTEAQKHTTTATTPTQINALTTAVESILPALSGSKVTYNAKHNIYLSDGYTSAAGNTYFQGIRLSDRLIVNYDFGQGYYYLFLNGIRLYGYDGNEKKLIASRTFSCNPFCEANAKKVCREMLLDFMKSQLLLMKQSVPIEQLEEFSRAMIDAVGSVNRKLLY